MSISDKDLGLKSLVKEINTYNKAVIKVGIQNNAGFNSDGVSILDYAQANEFGTINIPERSFIRATADAKKAEWYKRLNNGLAAVLDGKKSVLGALSEVGISTVSDIKLKITNAKTDPDIKPNAQATIDKKKSSSPLIDTGAMRNSVRYVFENI